MKKIKLLKIWMVFLAFCVAFCTACNNPGTGHEDLDKLTELLKPIQVLGDSFELELASKDQKGNKENSYSLSKPANFEKQVFVVEFNVDSSTNSQKLADAYANYLKESGENVYFAKSKDKSLSTFYSIDRRDNLVYLFVSKFVDKAPAQVLKNEYIVQLSKQQDNKTYIQQIVNNFINTDMIDIRHIIIEKQGNVTNVRSY